MYDYLVIPLPRVYFFMHHLLSLAVELGRAVIALVRSFLQMPPLVSSEILLLRKTPFTEPTLVRFDDPVDALVP